ncbi:MAG: hypothetical protein ACLFV3_04070 [Phycisphaeraceae bacterium]
MTAFFYGLNVWAIWLVTLAFLLAALLAVGIMGYASGLTRRSNFFSMVIMVDLVSIVLLLMIDLEYNWEGIIQTSSRPLHDVEAEIHGELGSQRLEARD